MCQTVRFLCNLILSSKGTEITLDFSILIYTWTRRSVIALFRNIFIQNCHDKNKVLFIIDGAPTTNDTWTIAVGLLYIQQDIFQSEIFSCGHRLFAFNGVANFKITMLWYFLPSLSPTSFFTFSSRQSVYKHFESNKFSCLYFFQ